MKRDSMTVEEAYLKYGPPKKILYSEKRLNRIAKKALIKSFKNLTDKSMSLISREYEKRGI